MTHDAIRKQLQQGTPQDEATQRQINLHLENCAECRRYALMLTELAAGDWAPYRPKSLAPAAMRIRRDAVKAKLANNRRHLFAPLPSSPIQTVSFALGVLSLLIMGLLFWQLTRPTQQQVAPTANSVTVTIAPTHEPTSTSSPTATATAAPTEAVAIITEPVVAATEAVTTAVAPVVTVAATAPPTATPSPTLAPTEPPVAAATAVATIQPTSVSTAPASAEQAPPIVRRLIDALNANSAENLGGLFANRALYATQTFGHRDLARVDIVSQLALLQLQRSQFSTSNCFETARDSDTQIDCTLTMTNNWRSAFGFAPYQSQLRVLADGNQQITLLTDFQHQVQSRREQAALQKFVNWHQATYPTVQLPALSVDMTVTYVRDVSIIRVVDEWVLLGKP